MAKNYHKNVILLMIQGIFINKSYGLFWPFCTLPYARHNPLKYCLKDKSVLRKTLEFIGHKNLRERGGFL